jgi:hypothetical protein
MYINSLGPSVSEAIAWCLNHDMRGPKIALLVREPSNVTTLQLDETLDRQPAAPLNRVEVPLAWACFGHITRYECCCY